jgi:small redox-active disulfide protein 2
MKIQILGSGCSKCKTLEANAREAVMDLGIEAEIEKVSDFEAIANMGVMTTPALVIDGEVRSVGRVLTKTQVADFINAKKR